MYSGCHARSGAFPDGLPYFAQASLLLEMFQILAWAVDKERESNSGN